MGHSRGYPLRPCRYIFTVQSGGQLVHCCAHPAVLLCGVFIVQTGGQLAHCRAHTAVLLCALCVCITKLAALALYRGCG